VSVLGPSSAGVECDGWLVHGSWMIVNVLEGHSRSSKLPLFDGHISPLNGGLPLGLVPGMYTRSFGVQGGTGTAGSEGLTPDVLSISEMRWTGQGRLNSD